MKSYSVKLILALHVFCGCGPPFLVSNEKISSALKTDSLPPAGMVKVFMLSRGREHDASVGSVLNLSCDNVYNANSPADWVKTNVSATSSFSLVAQKNCRAQVVSYDDGNANYTASGALLTIALSNLGVVSSTPAFSYTSGGTTPIIQWFSAEQGQNAYTVNIKYTAHAIASVDTAKTSLVGHAVSLNVASITAPLVSSLVLFSQPSLNNAAASNTLIATVQGYSSCKLINNSANTYIPTSWSSVNTAFNAATTTCPVMVEGQLGFSVGNWTSYWQPGQKTLLIWAMSVNGLNAYAAANIGP